MRIFALFGRPEFLRGFHGYATLTWFVISFPLAYFLGSSVVFVTFLSLSPSSLATGVPGRQVVSR